MYNGYTKLECDSVRNKEKQKKIKILQIHKTF